MDPKNSHSSGQTSLEKEHPSQQLLKRRVPSEYSINFYGVDMKLCKKLDRFVFIVAFGDVFLILLLLFINGCVVATEDRYPGQLCPNLAIDCIVFATKWSVSPKYAFECTSGAPVILRNSTDFRALCYGYILSQQHALDILNQLGIITGVLSISNLFVEMLCWCHNYNITKLLLCFLSIAGWVVCCLIVAIPLKLETVSAYLVFLAATLISAANMISLQGKTPPMSTMTSPPSAALSNHGTVNGYLEN
ncbi:unnamed protein product, partial [Rotaria magnacalcarata]